MVKVSNHVISLFCVLTSTLVASIINNATINKTNYITATATAAAAAATATAATTTTTTTTTTAAAAAARTASC